MNGRIPILPVAVALMAASAPAVQAQSWFWDGHLRVEGSRDAGKCSDLRARADGELAKESDKFTLSKREAPTLQVQTGSHNALHVRGWDRPDYEVEICKFAVAGTRSDAERILKSIEVRRDGARFTAIGPDHERDWHVAFLIHAPKDAALNLESGNAPVDLLGVNGKLMIRATNGPLSLADCSGNIQAETVNGPISFTGGAGEVHLRASNGPISLQLTGDVWQGSVLEATTNNGPLSAKVPSGFHSGLRVESSGHAPIRCAAAVCLNAHTEGNRFFPHLLRAGSGDTVRLSTHNGPVSVSSTGRRERLI